MKRGLLEIQRSTFLLSSDLIVMWLMMGFVKIIVRDDHRILTGVLERKQFLYFCWKLWSDVRESKIWASKSFEYWADDEISPSGNLSSVKSGASQQSQLVTGPWLMGTNLNTFNHFPLAQMMIWSKLTPPSNLKVIIFRAMGVSATLMSKLDTKQNVNKVLSCGDILVWFFISFQMNEVSFRFCVCRCLHQT